MPTYFMRTYGQSAGFGDAFTSDMDTAVLDITPELVDLCRLRSQHILKLAAKDEPLWELHFWDEGRVSWWEFYPSELIERLGLIGAEDDADSDQLVELTDPSALPPDKACAVECAQMRILVYRHAERQRVCEFGWGAYRKHGDVWVTTPMFALTDFEEALAKVAARSIQPEKDHS